MSDFFSPTSRGYLLKLAVTPQAPRTEVVGLQGDRLKVRVHAPPEKGAANRELLAFLARELGLPKAAVVLKGGAGERHKVVEVAGSDPELPRRLNALLPAKP